MYEKALKELGPRQGINMEDDGRIYGRVGNHLEMIYDDIKNCSLHFAFRIPIGALPEPDLAKEEFMKMSQRKKWDIKAANLKINDSHSMDYIIPYGYTRQLQASVRPIGKEEVEELEYILKAFREYIGQYEFLNYEAPFVCGKCCQTQVEAPVIWDDEIRLLCGECRKALLAEKEKKILTHAGIKTDWKKGLIFAGIAAAGAIFCWLCTCYAAELLYKGLYLPAAYGIGFFTGWLVIREARKPSPGLFAAVSAITILAAYCGRVIYLAFSPGEMTTGEVFLNALWNPENILPGIMMYLLAVGGTVHGLYQFRQLE